MTIAIPTIMLHLLFILATIALRSSAFSPIRIFASEERPSFSKSARTRLKYAALDDPMSKADSTKSGCPFLIQKYEFRTFDVPVLFGTDNRPIILYDENCPISSRMVTKTLKYGNIRFAPFQSSVGDLLLRRMSEEVRNQVVQKRTDDSKADVGDSYASIVVCDVNKTYVKSSAVLEIMRLLTSTDTGEDRANTLSMKHSKRFKLLQYLALLSYIIPNRLRDRVYDLVNMRKRLFGTAKTVDLKDHRYVNDSLLRDGDKTPMNLFQSPDPPTRGSRVKIVYPSSSSLSITYDDEFPNGLCLVGGIGTISTVDLPMRIVLRVERQSLGLKDAEDLIAWVKPEEIALL